ncbi:Uncharacterized protein MLTONO_p0377 (plasmid) [Mesorhizobium loti]|nr:Uncharacterized protein MLTONO_p0377 [Mesorhizobium loti]
MINRGNWLDVGVDGLAFGIPMEPMNVHDAGGMTAAIKICCAFSALQIPTVLNISSSAYVWQALRAVMMSFFFCSALFLFLLVFKLGVIL